MSNVLSYDRTAFLEAISTLREYIAWYSPDYEVGMIVLQDEDAFWHISDIVEGQAESISYDFTEYFSRDPDINPLSMFPQGTVHYHPKIDTDKNYLPSAMDLEASAEMARNTGEWFVCGVVNHKMRATLTFVNKSAYDYIDDEWADRINTALDSEDRKRVLQLEHEMIDDLQEKNHIIIEEIS